MPSRDEAVNLFIDRMVREYQHAFEGRIDHVLKRPDVPAWWRPGDPPLESEDNTQFRERVEKLVGKLDDGDRETVEQLIRGAALSAIRRVCHLLDGYSGGGDGSFASPLPGAEIAEFALYLKAYADGEAWQRDEAVASVRITDNGRGDHLLGWLIAAIDARPAQE